MDSKLGIVVNYFRRNDHPALIRDFTLLSLKFLRNDDDKSSILLVDGSSFADTDLSAACTSLNVNYLHMGKEIGFAEALNLGWNLLKEDNICFMANDILVPSGTLRVLQDQLKISDVGCVFPYLSYCDYPGQTYGFVSKPITCEPSVMTINLNIFKRYVLEKAMGVDENYSGSYNDLILLMKIRELGFRVILVGDTSVFHLGKMTIAQGSTYAKDKDQIRFREEYRSYATSHGMWQVKHWKWPLATTPLVSLLWWISQNSMSTRFRNWSQSFIMKIEPELTRYPARYGKCSN
jgi:GT2 family glycosyltransferase